MDFTIGSEWFHTMVVTMQNMYDGTFTGHGQWNDDPSYTWDISNATVVGNTVTFHILYTGTGAGYALDCTASINSSGELVGGVCAGNNSGTFVSTSGNAVMQAVGAGYPGQIIPTFTFTTDAYGAGSWHVNLTDADLPGSATSLLLSVWINGASGTILISNNFNVVKG